MNSTGYKITVNGKAHIYATLELAKKVAEEIFAETGVIVGIEKDNYIKPDMALEEIECLPEIGAEDLSARQAGVLAALGELDRE